MLVQHQLGCRELQSQPPPGYQPPMGYGVSSAGAVPLGIPPSALPGRRQHPVLLRGCQCSLPRAEPGSRLWAGEHRASKRPRDAQDEPTQLKEEAGVELRTSLCLFPKTLVKTHSCPSAPEGSLFAWRGGKRERNKHLEHQGGICFSLQSEVSV